MVNLVHDEIVLEMDKEHAEAGRVWLERCMVDGMNEMVSDDVPVSVEINIGDTWADKGKEAPPVSVPSEAIEPPRAQAHPAAPAVSGLSEDTHHPAERTKP